MPDKPRPQHPFISHAARDSIFLYSPRFFSFLFFSSLLLSIVSANFVPRTMFLRASIFQETREIAGILKIGNNRAMNGGCCSPLSSATIDRPRKRLSSGLISWRRGEGERRNRERKNREGKNGAL